MAKVGFGPFATLDTDGGRTKPLRGIGAFG